MSQCPSSNQKITIEVEKELEEYSGWIRKFRAGEIGDIKMQKIRLQLGTYAQRQDGVQMQRIKIPGGVLSSAQLLQLARAAEKYGSGFIHFTTRQDAQIYYIKLEDCPALLRDLMSVGITTREACGNTVRNITACYRSGIAADEVFDVTPYNEALFRFLLRNKYNQVMGRKFKIAFEGCVQDHSGMRFHDIGWKAVIQNGKRGFRVYLGGGLGAVPILGELYTEFLPEEKMLELAAALVRLFDRYGERKNRMQARMKFLIKKLGWEDFKSKLDQERKAIKLPASANDFLGTVLQQRTVADRPFQAVSSSIEKNMDFVRWTESHLVAHRVSGFHGVIVRLKLGDLTTPQAEALAKVADDFSQGELRVTMDQNLFLPWVPQKALFALYQALSKINLADSGGETLEDTTTCPGADTCRLGITSAKGLGSSISASFRAQLESHRALTKDLRVKISGCPNGCAQHAVASIGFQGAALSQEGKTVPAHEVYVGGDICLDQTRVGERVGKFPARNGPQIVETLVALFAKEKNKDESFAACMVRLGKDRIKNVLEPLAKVPSFQDDPSFYQDWGHDNEKFAIRAGIKGECAGSPIQEKVPTFHEAREKFSQAAALLAHEEWENAHIQIYEAIAASARVPLYALMVDPFTSEQVIWEFENIFVRSGKTSAEWDQFSEKVEAEKIKPASEKSAQVFLEWAKKFHSVCEQLAEKPAPAA